MKGILCILLYLLVVFTCYKYCKMKYSYVSVCNQNRTTIMWKRKFPIIAIMVFSLLLAMINLYSTNVATIVGGDRTNYIYDYIYGRNTTIGLDFLFKLAKSISLDINSFFYLTTFICCFFTFLAYRLSDESSSNVVLFLLSTNFVFFTFTGLKQCYACALASIFFALILKKKSLKRDVICLITIVLACLFHAAGFILVPIYLLFWISQSSFKYRRVFTLLIFLCAVFFEPITLSVAKVTSSFLPYFSAKIIEYFGEGASSDSSSNIVFLRGFPFYILYAYCWMNKKYFSLKIKNYDLLMILTLLASIFFLLTIKSYWVYRLTSMFYFPMGVLYDDVITYSSYNNRIVLNVLIIGTALFFTLRSVLLVFINYGGF